jgi:dTDP-3-amino-3,4,6-trideoxy-alpha-D-glucose transaminase
MSVSAGGAAIAMVDLNPLLEETEPAWRKHLYELRDCMQFVLGEQVRQFENAFAHYLGAGASVGCGSGTSAIELCLRAAKVTRPSQKVLTPAFTSPFTAQAIFAAGARPLFCDVDPDTLLLDPALAEQQSHRDLAAILPVHLYGQPCDLPRLRRLAEFRGAVLVQDACQAHGARWSGTPLTQFSDFVAYSFYPTKNLGCLGDGGAVATNSIEVADCLRLLRDGGRREDQLSRVVAVNSRLDELQACFLRAFLPRLESWNQERSRLADVYDAALAGCMEVRPVRRSAHSVNHLYVIRVPRREQLRDALLREGVRTAVHYPVPLHLHPAFSSRRVPKGSFPNAERAAGEVLSLPLHPHLGDSSVLRIAEIIRSLYG